MQVHLALLRGINVSGHNIIKMEGLRKIMEASGFEDVSTYIQSGNLIFCSQEKSKSILSEKIKKMILNEYGFDVSVIMLNLKDVEKAVTNNPFVKEKNIDMKQVYVVFLSEKPSAESIACWNFIEPEITSLSEDIMYIKYSENAGNSKLTNAWIEKKLKVRATARNWNTTQKLLELLKEKK